MWLQWPIFYFFLTCLTIYGIPPSLSSHLKIMSLSFFTVPLLKMQNRWGDFVISHLLACVCLCRRLWELSPAEGNREMNYISPLVLSEFHGVYHVGKWLASLRKPQQGDSIGRLSHYTVPVITARLLKRQCKLENTSLLTFIVRRWKPRVSIDALFNQILSPFSSHCKVPVSVRAQLSTENHLHVWKQRYLGGWQNDVKISPYTEQNNFFLANCLPSLYDTGTDKMLRQFFKCT